MTSDERVRIGRVAVDSGNLTIVDPCYVADGRTYEDLLGVESMHDPQLHELYRPSVKGDVPGVPSLAVTFISGLGDDLYDVYATIGEVPGWGRRIKKVEIILIDDDSIENGEPE